MRRRTRKLSTGILLTSLADLEARELGPPSRTDTAEPDLGSVIIERAPYAEDVPRLERRRAKRKARRACNHR